MRPLRWWIWAYVALAVLGIGVTLASSDTRVRLLGLYLVYMLLACTFVPLPTTPVILLAGAHWNPVLVALCGAAATTIANLNEYHVWTSFFRYRLFRKIRGSRYCKAGIAWFDKAPFPALFVVNIIPLPVDVVRLIAVARGYNRMKFAAANFLGRALRYGLIAFVGYALDLNFIAIIGITIICMGLGLIKAVLIGKKSNTEFMNDESDN